MTVRTEKIQALTGSAPLKLPTSLPSTNTPVQVDTDGTMTAESGGTTTFNTLTNGAGETGWVCLNSVEQDGLTAEIDIQLSSGSSVSASDIYMYKVIFDLHGSNSTSSSGQYLYISPLNGSTNISNGNLYPAGWVYSDSSSTSYGPYGDVGSNGNFEFSMSGVIGTGNSAEKYSEQFDMSTTRTSGYPWRAGIYGEIRYYNGAGLRHFCEPDMAMNWSHVNGNGDWYQYSYGYQMYSNYYLQKPYSTRTNTQFADGFKFHSNSSYKWQGNVQLWGITKT